MGSLIDIKENLKRFYGKCDSYLISLMKFAMALCAFIVINTKLGQMTRLNSIIIVLVLALICSFLPPNAIVLFGSIMIILHLYVLSLPAFIVGGGVIVILLLLYFGLAPKVAYAVILTPIAFVFHIPCVIPLIFGLVGTPLAGIGIAIGTIGYYAVVAVSGTAVGESGLSKDVAEAMVQKITLLLDGILKNPGMIIMVITMIAVMITVYVIRKMAIKYAWTTAIVVGAFMFLVITFMGDLILGMSEGFLALIIGTVVSVGIAFLIKLFLFEVDYRRTEKVQFEDDEFYYYVTAVPKILGSQKIKKQPTENKLNNKQEETREQVRADRRERRGSRSDIDIRNY